MIIGFINCLLFFFQSLALLETELPVKIAVLNVLQRFSRNSGKFHLTAKEVDKFMVYLMQNIQGSHKLWKSWKTWKITQNQKKFHVWKNQ